MTEDVIEQEDVPLEGDYQYPNVSVKTFTSTTDLGNWLTLTRPNIIGVQTKQLPNGSLVYELQVQKGEY
jgi:hypothetical protein